MKRPMVLALALAAAASWTVAASSLGEMFRTELEVQRRLMTTTIKTLGNHQADLQEAWTRADRLAEDLLRAEQDGESAASLRLRDQDLREAEGELIMHILASQRLRSQITEIQTRIEQIQEILKQVEGTKENKEDPLSGRWHLVIEPGGQEGDLELSLNGTLVSGIYHLSGDWYGSFRGTFVAGKVRLERVDSQLGFAAVFYGRYSGGDTPRLEGTWEGTHLAAGQPAGGSWVATRLPEPEETGYPESPSP
jgi:hypothetical protein